MHKGEIAELAKCMAAELYISKPVLSDNLPLGWHLPYIDDNSIYEIQTYVEKINKLAKEPVTDIIEIAKAVSASCCAQVSYRTLDTSIEKAMSIFNKLVGGNPIHASPFEHQAIPCKKGQEHCNFTGWSQYRNEIEDNDNETISDMVQTM